MQIQITAAPDPALVAAAVRHGLRRPVLLTRCAGWAMLTVVLVVQLGTGRLSPLLLAGGAVLGVLVPMLMINHTARRAMRARLVTTYEISASGVASSDGQSRHSYAWRAFRSVEQLSGQLLFRLGGADFLPVPTAGLTAAQVEHVLALASASGLRVVR